MGKPLQTYIQIQAEIERLSAEAKKALHREKDEVIGRIRIAIDAYGLTAADLGLAAGRGRRRRRGQPAASAALAPAPKKAAKKPKSAASAKLPPKYADGKGNQWAGRGSRPKWFLAAIAEGRTEADLLITK